MADEDFKDVKVLHKEEVKQHSDSNSPYLIIDNKVYDVSKFLEEHPGGEEVLLEQAGGDATEAFEDVGHSSDARDLMKYYFIADLHHSDQSTKSYQTSTDPHPKEHKPRSSWTGWLIPLGVALAAVLLYCFVYQ